jgi:predicted metalloprotease with PDZ domain
MKIGITAGLIALLFTAAALGANSEPQPAPMPPPIEPPRDVPYIGAMTLDVDATDLDHRIFRFHEKIPVNAGPTVLLYSRWLPGHHSPTGALNDLAGIRVTGGGQNIVWTRDPADVYAFHITVPSGVKEIEVDAQFLSATDEPHGPIAMTQEMLRLNWYATAFYPAGYFMRRIDVDASVKLPAGWQFGTALEADSPSGAAAKFKRVSFETLVDSPVIAGKHFKKFDLDPNGRSRVTLNVAADEDQYLEAKPEVLAIHRELIKQIDKLYGARHYNHYDFLLTLSDTLATMGVEHQRSSDNGVKPKYFTAWDSSFISRDLLAHEFNHSWCGKYRRPADLWTPNLNVPMRDSLLWVYEGQTEYYGNVLAARSGFLKKELALDNLANTAATYQARVGRTWRNLEDTTNDPIVASRRPIPWLTWQRSEDYYAEGELVWLEIDTLIRQRSNNKRSLDDFAHAFFGVNDGDWGQLTYTFDDIVTTLNSVEPYDWATLLRQRLYENAAGAPLEGIARGGYKLVYTEDESPLTKDLDTRRKQTTLLFSLGGTIENKGKLTQVVWDGPLFKAGLTVGEEIVAVNGVAYEGDRLKSLVKASKTDSKPIELLIKEGETYRTVRVDYHEGLRYPHLERVKGTPGYIDDIITAKK